jgi:microcystin-dependent protein
MSDAFVGEVRIFGFNFAPSGWAQCDGQIMPISQNTALFSLIGTFYGGDGRSTFALPDLRNHFVLGAGTGPGLTPRDVGERGGAAAVTLQPTQMPPHAHLLLSALSPTASSPTGAAMAPTLNGTPAYHAASALVPMSPSALAPAGGSQPHENRQPALTLNYCIALQGVFPPRP